MINTCRTCSGFSDSGGECVELDYFPVSRQIKYYICPLLEITISSVDTPFSSLYCLTQNATVAEYGEIDGGIFGMLDDDATRAHKIRAEIFARGPVATTINANPLRDYEGGVLDDETASTQTNHIVSITGFGKDPDTGKDYWIIRNR